LQQLVDEKIGIEFDELEEESGKIGRIERWIETWVVLWLLLLENRGNLRDDHQPTTLQAKDEGEGELSISNRV